MLVAVKEESGEIDESGCRDIGVANAHASRVPGHTDDTTGRVVLMETQVAVAIVRNNVAKIITVRDAQPVTSHDDASAHEGARESRRPRTGEEAASRSPIRVTTVSRLLVTRAPRGFGEWRSELPAVRIGCIPVVAAAVRETRVEGLTLRSVAQRAPV